MYKIYKLTMPNGKVYIGQTKLSLKGRWQRGGGYKYQPELYNDILAFGWDNVEHELLEEVEDTETAHLRERYYIMEYKSYLPEFGYNKHKNLFTVCEDGAEYSRLKYREYQEGKSKRQFIGVRCVETGEVFDSINEAAAAVNRSYDSLYKSLTRGNRCGGYHWERVLDKEN